jgi:hypothetical protein
VDQHGVDEHAERDRDADLDERYERCDGEDGALSAIIIIIGLRGRHQGR